MKAIARRTQEHVDATLNYVGITQFFSLTLEKFQSSILIMSSTIFEQGGFRITFGEQPQSGFHLEVSEDSKWRRASSLNNALVAGPSFDLRPDEIRESAHGLHLKGQQPSHGYLWSAEITRVGTQWIKVDITIDSPGFTLGKIGGIEPEIVLDLGPLPPYERGDHVWFKVNIDNPTKWNDEARSNDFPATYYYDPYGHNEFRMFFDMSEMSWMGPENVARFRDLRCGFRRRFDGELKAELGLIGETQSGFTFPEGQQKIVYYIGAGHREHFPKSPTSRGELISLVESALTLLPEPSKFPSNATSWDDFAKGAAIDLMNTEHSWSRDNDGEHLMNYVDARSDAWALAMGARGRDWDGTGACLESGLWILHPLEILSRVRPDLPFESLRKRVNTFTRRQILSSKSDLFGGVSAKPMNVGTWQYIYIIGECWRIYALSNDEEVLAKILKEVHEVMLPMVVNTGGVLPLEFDKSTLKKIGSGDGHAIAGLFALFMLEIAQYTADESYTELAKKALVTLYNLPINTITQESFLTAHSADAADRLAKIDKGNPEWAQMSRYFVAQSLRMMYWYNDDTNERNQMVDQLGMFVACGTINYPAFFENLEMDARLSALLNTGAPKKEMLNVLDHGRRVNFHFFPKVQPDLYGPMPLQYIPYEEVPVLEGGLASDGFIGQELYGSGWVFRALLIWEAISVCSNRELMVVNTTTYRETNLVTLVVSNSTSTTQKGDLEFPALNSDRKAKVTLSEDGRVIQDLVIAAGEKISIEIQPGKFLEMKYEDVTP